LGNKVGKEQICSEKSDPSDGLRNQQKVQLIRSLLKDKKLVSKNQ